MTLAEPGPRRIRPPALLRLTTTLPWQERSAMRHPAEIPWFVVACVVMALATGWFAVVLFAVVVGEVAVDETTLQLAAFVLSAPFIVYFARALMYARPRVSGVRLSPTQFPQAYAMLVEAARSHGLRRVPDAYVILGNGTINAFASGHGHRRYIALYSDLFEVGGAARNPQALRFIIGHEVGHIAAGHTSYFRIVGATVFSQIPILGPALSRAQEYTADNYGYRFAPAGAPGAMALLAAGKYLLNEVDVDAYADRAVTERGLFPFLVNLMASHPVGTWRAHALRDRSRPGRLLRRPRAGVAHPPSLPSGAERTARWASPPQAVDFLQANPRRPDTFGGVEVEAPPPRPATTPTLDHTWREPR